jgi:hypothetical protein
MSITSSAASASDAGRKTRAVNIYLQNVRVSTIFQKAAASSVLNATSTHANKSIAWTNDIKPIMA